MTVVKSFRHGPTGIERQAMPKPPTDHEKRIARNLRAFREEFGLSQSKMASAVGVPTDTWIKWETGARTPGGDMIFRIADAVDRPTDDLAAETPPPARTSIPPAFGLVVVDERVNYDLKRRAELVVADLNREHRRLIGVAEKGAPPKPPTRPSGPAVVHVRETDADRERDRAKQNASRPASAASAPTPKRRGNNPR